MTSISHPRRTDDTAMHHHPHGPGRTLEPSSGKAPATNHNHRGYSSQLQQQTSQPYTNQKDMGTTLAGTTQGSSGTSSTLTVLKRGDACLFCRKRKLKCDAVKPRCGQCVRLKKSPCAYDTPATDEPSTGGGTGTNTIPTSGQQQPPDFSSTLAGVGNIAGEKGKKLLSRQPQQGGEVMGLSHSGSSNGNLNIGSSNGNGNNGISSSNMAIHGSGSNGFYSTSGDARQPGFTETYHTQTGSNSESMDMALTPGSYEVLTSLLKEISGDSNSAPTHASTNSSSNAMQGGNQPSMSQAMQMQLQVQLQMQQQMQQMAQMQTQYLQLNPSGTNAAFTPGGSGYTFDPSISSMYMDFDKPVGDPGVGSGGFNFDALMNGDQGMADLQAFVMGGGGQGGQGQISGSGSRLGEAFAASGSGSRSTDTSMSTTPDEVVRGGHDDMTRFGLSASHTNTSHSDDTGNNTFQGFLQQAIAGDMYENTHSPSGYQLVLDHPNTFFPTMLSSHTPTPSESPIPTVFQQQAQKSASTSPGSVVNLPCTYSPGTFELAVVTAADPEDLPSVFKERLIASYMRMARRFGLHTYWPRFWERMRGDEADRPHPAWVNAIYTIGAKNSDDPALRKLEKHFASNAEKHFNQGLIAWTRLVDLIRAATLMGMYMYWTAQFHKAWDMAGRASRLVAMTGLHQIPTGSFSRLKNLPTTFQSGELPWQRRHRTFTLPSPKDALELGEQIMAFWDVFQLDRAGSIATQWNMVLDTREIKTPLPLPMESYLRDDQVPVEDERLHELLEGRLGPVYHSNAWRRLTVEAIGLIEGCSNLIYLRPEETDVFGQTLPDQNPSDPDSHLKEVSSARRCPQAHYRLENAIEALKARVPASLREVVETLSMGGNGTLAPITVINVDNYALNTRIINAQMLLYDIDDWRSENARSLQLARRIVGLTRMIPAHEYENLDGFTPILWMTTSRVLIKEVKRCHSVGDRSGQTEATKDLDDLIGFYTRGSASSTLCAAQLMRVINWKKTLMESLVN